MIIWSVDCLKGQNQLEAVWLSKNVFDAFIEVRRRFEDSSKPAMEWAQFEPFNEWVKAIWSPFQNP